MAKRWQRVLDCLGAEPPPVSQGTLLNCRMRLITHNWAKTLLDRTVALAEHPGGFGARQLRAVLDSTPRCGAGRGADTLPLLGQALRQAVGLAAQALDTSVAARVEEAGLTLVGHRSLKAALDVDWGEPSARSRAQRITPDTEPDPEGGPGGRRITKHVAPDRRIAIEAHDRRHGRPSSAKT